jgi:pimeloyl-ACP methyl ester carboxylesterase
MAAIVYLPGILGSHLRRPGGERLWLEIDGIWKGALGPHLALGVDGVTEAGGGLPLLPDGHLEPFYGLAASRWRAAGITVHEYSYDWRKSVTREADELARYLDRLPAGESVALVAHSMGGLVACEYASRYPAWKNVVERAILIGTPLRGSFSPMEAVTGDFRLSRLLAALTIGIPDHETRQRELACTLPGLIDMLPDPDVFPSAASLYAKSAWPDGLSPPQPWLDASLALKRRLIGSPLLERAVVLASKEIPTPVEARVEPRPETSKYGAGDGLVPLRAALREGVPAFGIRFLHAVQMLDPAAIKAVRLLARGEEPDLDRLTVADADSEPALLDAWHRLRRYTMGGSP